MCPKAKLSHRLKRFVDMLQSGEDTMFRPPDFWPAWLCRHLKNNDDTTFTDDEKRYLKDLSFQSFDKDGFFMVLKMLEGTATHGSSPPTRSNFFPKI